MAATVQALPSCLAYQITGVCFFLKCTPVGCSIETSIRVSHYAPDVIVSTYNDALNHPWIDVGPMVAGVFEKVGSSMMGFTLDSSANTAREAQEIATFKSADAIGNPIGAMMAGGGTFEFLDFQELMNFPSQELPRILRLWAGVPVQAGNQLFESARTAANNATSLINSIGALPNQFGGMLSEAGGLLQSVLGSPMSSVFSAGGSSGGSGGANGGGGSDESNAGGPPTFDQMVDQMKRIFREAGVSGGTSSSGNNGGISPFICPGNGGLFSIHYHSAPDSVFWRSKLPVELLYPAAWIPGFDEVTVSGLSTWGSFYPRVGELVQSHPVKASAVFASRVANIISQPYQPHIYKQLSVKADSERRYVYFERGSKPLWQPVWPVPEPGCIQFGENDSLNLFTSWGDYRTSSNYGYIWNLWRRYVCCERKTPIYLFAIPP